MSVFYLVPKHFCFPNWVKSIIAHDPALNVLSVLPNFEDGVTPKRFKIFQSFNGSYMLLHHLVLGSRTYLLLHKCTTLNYVVEKSTFTELLSLLPKRTVGVDIAKKNTGNCKLLAILNEICCHRAVSVMCT